MRIGNDDRPRVVLDTDVLLSALAFEGRETVKIWDLAEEGRIEVFVSVYILAELQRNLVKQAAFSQAEAEELIDIVLDRVEVVRPSLTLAIIRRKDSDNRILECAVAAHADILITGNTRDLRPLAVFRGVRILTPGEFLEEWEAK